MIVAQISFVATHFPNDIYFLLTNLINLGIFPRLPDGITLLTKQIAAPGPLQPVRFSFFAPIPKNIQEMSVPIIQTKQYEQTPAYHLPDDDFR